MQLHELEEACLSVIDDPGYASIMTDMINAAVLFIAGGVRMPNRSLSPPLPDLYSIDTINTDPTAAFVAMPTDYQRACVFCYSPVADAEIHIVDSFAKFLRLFPSLAVPGAVELVSIKGANIYYQGIPTIASALTVHYHRLPTAMVDAEDAPDGIPPHLQERLIKHRVAWVVFDEIEDGVDGAKVNTAYHQMRFYEAMDDLIAFVGIDGTPQFYEDAGVALPANY